MNLPNDLKYARTHEWVRQNADGTLTVGITDHAQEALGDVVFIELPELGRELAAAEECAVIESVKAASDIYAPVAGKVVAINQAVIDEPELVNQDAYANWLFAVQPANAGDIADLLDAAGYAAVAADH